LERRAATERIGVRIATSRGAKIPIDCQQRDDVVGTERKTKQVRKILITLGIVILCVVAILALWVFYGRQFSSFIDRFATIEVASTRINSIAYEGGGTSGTLIINDARMSLSDVNPKISLNIGSSKDNQFALASGGKVFGFGPFASTAENASYDLAAVPQPGDDAAFVTRRSALSWPTPFEFNFMTGQSPSWKRYMYYQLRWKKSSGPELEMLWRYEQYFYPGNGWASGFMIREGSTGLVRLEIKD